MKKLDLKREKLRTLKVRAGLRTGESSDATYHQGPPHATPSPLRVVAEDSYTC